VQSGVLCIWVAALWSLAFYVKRLFCSNWCTHH
jgi:hypothetical protein